MATLKLNKFILLPGRALAALVRCGFPVSGGDRDENVFPRYGPHILRE